MSFFGLGHVMPTNEGNRIRRPANTDPHKPRNARASRQSIEGRFEERIRAFQRSDGLPRSRAMRLVRESDPGLYRAWMEQKGYVARG